jgi:Heterokaryon incompatibility protein (HET)
MDTFLDWLRSGGASSGRTLEDAMETHGSPKVPQRNPALFTARSGSYKSSRDPCPTCCDLDLEKVLLMKPEFWGSFILDLGPAHGSWTRTNCDFCQILSDMRPQLGQGEATEALALYAFRQSRYLWPISSRGVILAVIPIRDAGVKAPTDMSAFLPVLSGVEKPQISADGGAEISRFLCPVKPSALVQNGGKMKGRLIRTRRIDFSLLRSWIRACQEQHSHCCDRPERPFTHRPRYINCLTRIIEDASPTDGYVALSYVWGNVPVEKDIADNSILRDSLPATIEDAIRVTEKLGYRYLWVDRYCIPQDEEKEKMRQIQQMDLIYQRAEVVIIAAFGDDPTHGLPGVGQTPRTYQPRVKRGSHVLASTMQDPKLLINSSVWRTRAWTYQEGLLARRRLVFTEEQVYFECWGMNRRETVDLDVDAVEINHFIPRPGLRSPGAGGRAILQNIAAFTTRELTKESDILNAFTGILNVYARADPAVHSYWGVPILPSTFKCPGDTQYTLTQGFISGLCWKSLIPGRRRPGFPSWSWAGWKDTHAVSPQSREYIVGVKLASQSDIQVSLFHNGRLRPWHAVWKDTYDPNAVPRDLPKHIYINAWTTDVRLIHSSSLTAAAGRKVRLGFYAYPAGTTPSPSEVIALSQAPAFEDDTYRDPTGDRYLGIFLGRADRLAAELFVLIVKRIGESFERIGSVQFPMAQLAARDGWFGQMQRRVVKLE